MKRYLTLSEDIRTMGSRAQGVSEGRKVWVGNGGRSTYHIYSSKPHHNSCTNSYMGYVLKNTIDDMLHQKEITVDKLHLPDKFYMIVRHPHSVEGVTKDGYQNPRLPEENAPRSMYTSKGQAEEVATDLAMRTGKKFAVLEAISSFEVEKPVVRKTL
ncbi:hypothetical protein NVP1208B_46 [Vibrio phage 1.208.B._10N.222.52.A7]|nr:hypothetical protein NVP1208B_46 [Vibrio phage 1.208.B._10N.222.52.A7]